MENMKLGDVNERSKFTKKDIRTFQPKQTFLRNFDSNKQGESVTPRQFLFLSH